MRNILYFCSTKHEQKNINMAEPKIKIFNDGKGKWQSYEATVSIDLSIDDHCDYAKAHGCRINTFLDFDHTEYGADELEALQNLNCSLSYLIDRLTSCREAVYNRIKEKCQN